MRICIVGGGNIGTLLAGEAAADGYDVTVYTSKVARWSHNITVKDIHGSVIAKGHIQQLTDDLKRAISGQDYIFVTLPSVAQSDFAQKAAPYITAGQRVVMIPGYGGTEMIMQPLVKNGAVLIGFERVQAISRLISYGHEVCMRGRKDSLQMATFVSSKDQKFDDRVIAADLQKLFKLPVQIMPNFLNITFTPSNPVLHTSRLYSMFKDYYPGIYYPENIPFYDGWTDFSSEIMMKLDSEVQLLCKTLSKLDLSGVKSLKVHYESPTIQLMTHKLTHIESFHGIMSPMKQTEKGWIPDFQNRYFSCDFPYGLEILHQFAQIAGVKSPMMDTVMAWYYKQTGKRGYTVDIRKYGLKSIDDIYRVY